MFIDGIYVSHIVADLLQAAVEISGFGPDTGIFLCYFLFLYSYCFHLGNKRFSYLILSYLILSYLILSVCTKFQLFELCSENQNVIFVTSVTLNIKVTTPKWSNLGDHVYQVWSQWAWLFCKIFWKPIKCTDRRTEEQTLKGNQGKNSVKCILVTLA